MYCHKCGKKLDDGTRFCPDCGTELTPGASAEEKPVTVTPAPNESRPTISVFGKKVICPVCKSKNLQVISEDHSVTQTKGGGFSATKGCLGYLLLGPFGLLCGNRKLKTKNYNIHKTFWVCSDCGHKFRNLEDWKNELDSSRRGIKILAVLSAVLLVLSVFLMILGSQEDFALVMGVIGLVLGLIMGGVTAICYYSLRKQQQAYEELERTSTES